MHITTGLSRPLTRGQTVASAATASRNEVEVAPSSDFGCVGSIPTGGTVLAQWAITWLSMALLKPKTRRMYESVLRSHILPAFGERPLESITRLDVQQWVAGKVQASSASHVRNMHSVLRQMLGEAQAQGFINNNPCDGVRLPKRVEADKRPLSLEQVRHVASQMGHYEDFVLTLAMTGMRWAECVGLRPEDVQDGTIVISSTLSEVDGKFHRVPTKTGKTRRIPIPAGLEGRLNVPFQTRWSNPIPNDRFRKDIWYPALERAGLPKVNVHSLRATCASELVRSGASVVLVSRWLGHSTPMTTLQRYSFLFEDDLSNLASKIA